MISIFKKKTIQYTPIFYTSIDSLPLRNYRKTYETDDLRYLAILDQYEVLPVFEVDSKIWDDIQTQCFEFSGTLNVTKYIAEQLYMLKLRRNYCKINDCIYLLAHKKDLEVAAILEKYVRKYKPDYVFNSTTDNDFCNSLIEADRQGRQVLDLLKMKSAAFENKHKRKATTKIDYLKEFSDIQRHLGMQLNECTYTVRQFLTDSQTKNKEIAAINKRNGKR